MAQKQVIESRLGGSNYNEYADSAFSTSSLKSSASGCTAGIGSRYGFSASCTVTLNPTLIVAGGTYLLEVTHGSASSVSTDIVVTVTISGGAFTNAGVTFPSTNTTAFQQSLPNTWKTVGTIVADPGNNVLTITCTTTNTDLNSTGNRFYSDAYRLTYTGEPCLAGLPELDGIDGPLYAGQTNVSVPGVSALATNINVYTNGVLVGNLGHGVVAGSNNVPTGALLKGCVVTATQTGSNGVESCDSSQGVLVGGGPDPRIRISLSLETDTSLTGPAGVAGTSTSGNYFFLGAIGNAGIGGFGTAPAGGQVVQPSTNWQTVTFNPSGDSGYYWAGAFSGSPFIQGTFAQLDAIAFCIDDLSDTGPFAIYIDDIVNGTNFIQGFESIATGTVGAQFAQPGSSTTTSPDLLAQSPGVISPNVSMVDNVAAASGQHSCFVSWQFRSTAAVNWLRLSFNSGAGATPSPMVDLSQTISFSLLLLPVGQPLPALPGAPVLATSFDGSNLTLNWSGNYYLQYTTNLTAGAWTDVMGATAPFTATVSVYPSAYFRLSALP